MSLWRDLLRPRTSGPWLGRPSRPAGAPALRSVRYERDGRQHRAQLRIDADGRGMLVVDARRMLRLEAHGVELVEALLAGAGREALVARTAGTGGEAGLARDLDLLEAALSGRRGLAPTAAINVRDPATEIGRAIPQVPLVATLEVVPETGLPVLAARVARAAGFGIGHVVLRAIGEVPDDALVAGVRAAEDHGLVAGVAAPARRLTALTLERLAEVGVDHVSVPVAGPGAAIHDAVLGAGAHDRLWESARAAASLEVPLVAELPLLEANWAAAPETLASLAALDAVGATAWALVSADDDPVAGAISARALRQVAALLEDGADGTAIPVTWAAPVRAGALPADLEAGPRTEGDFGVRVLRDGSVLAPRGPRVSAGSFDADAWETIARSGPWSAFRRRAEAVTRCAGCPGLALCAADCPAAPEGWA